MRQVFTSTVLMLLVVTLGAQTPTVASWRLRFYLPLADQPFQGPMTITREDAVCGLGEQTGSTTNPTRVVWDDPDNGNLNCVALRSEGQLISWPLTDGTYHGTLAACTSTGICSSESSRAVFHIAALTPSRPTQVQFRRDENGP